MEIGVSYSFYANRIDAHWLENAFVEFEEKGRKLSSAKRGRLSALSPMEIFIAMLIKV